MYAKVLAPPLLALVRGDGQFVELRSWRLPWWGVVQSDGVELGVTQDQWSGSRGKTVEEEVVQGGGRKWGFNLRKQCLQGRHWQGGRGSA